MWILNSPPRQKLSPLLLCVCEKSVSPCRVCVKFDRVQALAHGIPLQAALMFLFISLGPWRALWPVGGGRGPGGVGVRGLSSGMNEVNR